MELDTATSRVHTLEIENAAITEHLFDVQEQLHDAQDVISAQSDVIKQKNQRINRLVRDKAVLSGRIACKKQELAQAILSAAEAEKVSKAAALNIETLLQSISQLNAAASAQKAAKSELYKDLRATRMRETRAKTAVRKLRKELAAKSRWSGMNRHAYSSQSRSLAMAFVKAGCAQSRIGPLLSRVGKVFGISIRRSMSRRTVGRIITEAGVKVRLQLGHELARAKAICLSSDGTSNRNIKYEARHITYKAPTYDTNPDAPQEAAATRLVEVDHALDHTAQTQYEGWDVANQRIVDTYNNSPLARRDALDGLSYEADDLYRKTVSYAADHASDVRLAAHKVKERKQLVVESDLGRQEITSMSDSEVEQALWDVLQEMHDDPESLDQSSLSPEHRAEALQSLAAHLGSKELESLPDDRQQLLTRMVIAGCCGHKDHNCSKYGVEGMQAVWETLGLTPPVLLANKDNAATIALGEDADSAAVEQALKTSHRGGYKLVSICGDLFRHKDPKRGHRDLHRHFFSKVKFDVTGEHSTVKFPDTSNNRYGSHLAGAAELLKNHSAYLEFFRIIRDTKTTPGLNHMEQNALMGLENEETICELVIMTVYKNAVPDAYFKIVRKAGVNHIDLGPLHAKIIDHINKLIGDTDLLLNPLSPSEEATLDGLPFSDQHAMDSAHLWLMKHPLRVPVVEQLLIGLLTSTLPAWKRFSSEFEPGGPIDSLTPAEKLAICIPPTNDANESILGGLRDYSLKRGGTVKHFSAQAAYHRNNTEAFAAAKLGTEEDALYIMRLARVEDASGAMHKFRDELIAFKTRIAEEARQKQAEKEAEAAAELERLRSIAVITDVQQLKALPVKKKGRPNLREQLDVRRDLWKDEILVKTKLKDISKKVNMVAAILAADERYVFVIQFSWDFSLSNFGSVARQKMEL
ncbi:hypothetical protein MVEN_02318000 [Mycena venus]|uniref:Uncharacterized protein n=1 Tax=Mycena venus TaxID=2733690 RepID=A0A8H7CFK3_9AGAR|nr:hypothetical protein MVEN_02318000 [Mycena venus]